MHFKGVSEFQGRHVEKITKSEKLVIFVLLQLDVWKAPYVYKFLSFPYNAHLPGIVKGHEI